jgi:hypothetical protein
MSGASSIVDSEEERGYDGRLDDLESLRAAVRGSELRESMLRQWEARYIFLFVFFFCVPR